MRRTLILAAAIAALAATALPASASAYMSNWKAGGVELTEEGTLVLAGSWAFTGGTECHVRILADLEAGTGTGAITEFAETECVPTETLYSVCTEVTEVTPKELPWMLDDEGSSIKVTGIHITKHYAGGLFCPSTITVEDDTAEGGGLVITPNNTEAMETETLSGTVNTSYGTQGVSGNVKNVIYGL